MGTNGSAIVHSPQQIPPAVMSAATMESVIGKGDLSSLTPGQRVEYLTTLSQSMGLNPLTRPIQLLQLSGKTVAYATRDCTDQLRKIHGVSVRIVGRERIDDTYVVTAQATDATGRVDESTGAVVIGHLKGESLCNALMKSETKAKRRVTLSICGLGILDESELDTVKPVFIADDPPPTPEQPKPDAPFVMPQKTTVPVTPPPTPAAPPRPDPKSALNAMKAQVYATLEGLDESAKSLVLNTYLRAYFDLGAKGAMPKGLDYAPAMSALCDHLPAIAAELKADPAKVGVKLRDLNLPTVEIKWDELMEMLATKRGVTLEQVLEHFDTVGISERVTDEIEAYALLACYSKSARLAVSDKFTTRRVVTELTRKFGALWPINPALASDIEVALTTLTTSPDSPLLKN